MGKILVILGSLLICAIIGGLYIGLVWGPIVMLQVGEIKNVYIGQNIDSNAFPVISQGLISNNTVAVFLEPKGNGYSSIYIPVGSMFQISNFGIPTMMFKILSVNPQEITITIQRLS